MNRFRKYILTIVKTSPSPLSKCWLSVDSDFHLGLSKLAWASPQKRVLNSRVSC